MGPVYDVNKVYAGVEKYTREQMKYVGDPDCKLYNPVEGAQWVEPLWGEKPAEIDLTLSRLTDRVGRHGIHHSSPRDFTWIADQTNLASNLGEVVVSQLDNRNSKLAADIERVALLWMCKEIGYDDNADGFMTPGGNPSQVVVMATIREAMNIEPSETDKIVIYLSYTCHTCVDKGIIVVGMGHVKVNVVKLDEKFSMDVNHLKQLIEEDKKAGLKPFLVIPSFGTADVGSVDPLAEVSEVAKANKMWMHVDASIGCYQILDPEMRAKAKGIEQADSVCIGFNQPYGAHGILFKRGKDMRAAMGASERAKETLVWSNPIEDKAMPRGFPIWFSVKLLGVDFYRKVCKRNNQLGAYCAEWLRSLPGLTVLPCATNTAVFRVAGTRAEANPMTKKLWELTHKDGRVVLPPTTVDEYLFIRMGVNGIRPVYEAIQYGLKLITEKVTEHLGAPGTAGTRPTMSKDLEWIQKFESDYLANEAIMLDKTTGVVMKELEESTFKGRQPSGAHPTMQELWPCEEPCTIEKMLEMARGIPLRPNPSPYSLYAGTLGMYLACFTHPNCGVKFSNPGTFELETKMLAFLASKVGMPVGTMGVFANDGRTGNIMPMHSARSFMLQPSGPGVPRPVFYGSKETIDYFETPALAIGMGRDTVWRELKNFTNGAVDYKEFETAVNTDLKDPGLRPFFLAEIVTTGTIETTDRDQIADLVKKHEMWHHVDLSGTDPCPLWKIDGPKAVKGCDRINSMSLEVGSKLMQPVDITAILVPGIDKLRKALVTPRLTQYVVDTVDTSSFCAMFEPYVTSSELPKPCRVLTMWFTLMTMGSDALKQ